jgi:dTDP-4-dehydrorhamnose 3,5-epimerase
VKPDSLNVASAPLPGVKIFRPDRFEDGRGWFMELWNEERYRQAGLERRLVQTNVSSSAHGVLRGLHYQSPHEQGKLVTVLAGAVFDVVVDIRRGSPTFGQWFGCELSDRNRLQLWIPEGFAHGFLATTGPALVAYGATAAYNAEADRVIVWNDPDIAIAWPFPPASLSSRDAAAPRLANVPPGHLPTSADAGAPG